jgi:hypothetical protein
MKNSMKVLSAAALVAGLFSASNAFAQAACSTCASSSASTDAYARVVVPIFVCAEEEMNFGAFCAPATGSGTATVVTDHAAGTADGGTLTTSGISSITQGGIGNDPLDGDGPEEARFLVTGEPGLTYSIVTTCSGLGKLVGSAPALAIGGFTYNYGGAGPQTVGTLPATGSQELNVGATVTIPAGQASGWYHGTINMTTTYN